MGAAGKSRAETAKVPEPYFVKPSRTLEPEPEQVSVADAITAALADADLIESPGPVQPRIEIAEETDEELAEGRRAPRKSQIMPAYVTSPEMANLIPARVVDMSATGAKIELTPMGRSTGVPMTHLPDRFVLVLRHDKMEVDCETVWREEWNVGVRFLGFPRPTQSVRK